jgi:hypothetical protein
MAKVNLSGFRAVVLEAPGVFSCPVFVLEISLRDEGGPALYSRTITGPDATS